MELGKEDHALLVQCLGGRRERGDMFVARYACLTFGGDAVLIVDAGVFEYDHSHAAPGALQQIGEKGRPYSLVLFGGAHCQRRHDDAVLNGEVSDFSRFKQFRIFHLHSLPLVRIGAIMPRNFLPYGMNINSYLSQMAGTN